MLLCRRHCVKYRLLNLECNDNEGDLSQLIVVRGDNLIINLNTVPTRDDVQ